MFLDWTYIVLVLPAILFSLWASHRVKTTFEKYQRLTPQRQITGSDIARSILNANGLGNIQIEHISGSLTDHFDPRSNTIRLSDSVYGSVSMAAIGVAAHEVGHVLQHSTQYAPIKIRSAIVPITNFGSKLSMPLIMVGLILSSFGSVFVGIAYLGVACFSLCTIFQLVTLPTEFNASKRALTELQRSSIFSQEELIGSKKVLWAAAMTYVAALAVSLTQLLRFLIILNKRRR
jgi:Zn-dependent membrane protease YugP